MRKLSKLEQLINELCPDGVEYKKIKDAFQRLKGTPITAGKMKEIASDDGEIRIFAGGKTVINAEENDIPDANITRVPAVLVQSRGIIDIVYFERPFTFKNEMWAYTTEEKTTVKYLFYVLKDNIHYFRDSASGMGSLPQISLPITEELKIPLPPLPVQDEIVRILDNFTELTTQLNEDLTAELTARKQQYEYYRDSLMTFGDDVEWKPLFEIAEIGTGSSNTNEELEEGKYPFFVRSQRVRYKNEYEYDETAIITSGDGVGVGKIFHYVEGKYALHQRAYRIRICDEEIIPKFYYYYMKTKFLSYIEKESFNSSVTSIRRPMLNKFPVPKLDKDVQRHIIEKLDCFENLFNDISERLPAEINARIQQYEYYRNKLLNFKKKEVCENE